MKIKTYYTSIALSFGLVAASQGAITFRLNQAEGNAGSAILGSSSWDFEEGGPWANVYFDGNQDGVFGQVATDTYGDTNAGLADNLHGKTITDGLSMNFAVEGFDGANATSSAFHFDITNSNSTYQTVSVNEGSTQNFFDSNGDEWQVFYEFTAQGYGDVVYNLGTGPGGEIKDHKAVLVFEAVPEPSSAALLGLGGLALILRRRK